MDKEALSDFRAPGIFADRKRSEHGGDRRSHRHTGFNGLQNCEAQFQHGGRPRQAVAEESSVRKDKSPTGGRICSLNIGNAFRMESV